MNLWTQLGENQQGGSCSELMGSGCGTTYLFVVFVQSGSTGKTLLPAGRVQRRCVSASQASFAVAICVGCLGYGHTFAHKGDYVEDVAFNRSPNGGHVHTPGSDCHTLAW